MIDAPQDQAADTPSDLGQSRSDQRNSPIRLIAALGSSFAAGPGLDPVVDTAAMRSGANYAHLLAKALGADLVDRTVSGATTANILDTPQQTVAGIDYPPQISGLPADADLVTITAGGNDLQFIGSMLFVAWFKAAVARSIGKEAVHRPGRGPGRRNAEVGRERLSGLVDPGGPPGRPLSSPAADRSPSDQEYLSAGSQYRTPTPGSTSTE